MYYLYNCTRRDEFAATFSSARCFIENEAIITIWINAIKLQLQIADAIAFVKINKQHLLLFLQYLKSN